MAVRIPDIARPCSRCRLGAATNRGQCPWREEWFEADRCIALPSAEAEHVWYIREGWVAVSSASMAGDELACSVRGPDTMVGLEALAERSFRFEVWSLTAVVTCHLPLADLERWAPRPTGPAGALFDSAILELSRRNGDREQLTGSALERVARFLVRSLGAVTPEGQLPFLSKTLARVLGIRPETLSRSLMQLRALGALAEGRTITVVDAERLAIVAGESAD